ncbi:MAG TPA: pyridoxamine 5'-phosphate oxidase family protein [Mycobacteriales bacterium]|nr:pyridoxamine 5'-phosphate oxidase family protein [Mycobacteriales bacterium]
MTGKPQLDVIDREHCMRLLARHPLGRILYTNGALPAIQPVNYALDGNSIVVRTESESKLAAAGRGQVVAFEIDDIDTDHGSGWSVVVTGRATTIASEHELARAQELPIPAWFVPDQPHFIRIQCELVTGRRLRRARRTASGHGEDRTSLAGTETADEQTG